VKGEVKTLFTILVRLRYMMNRWRCRAEFSKVTMRLPFKSLQDHKVGEETGNDSIRADLILRERFLTRLSKD
jgi:hypothetical protein